jgi:hypothetical protein
LFYYLCTRIKEACLPMNIIEKIIFFLLLITIVSCNRPGNKDIPANVVDNPASATGKPGEPRQAAMSFTSDMHDFGKVYEGETVSYAFKFKNSGNADLVIANVSSSCGCTVTDYPEDAVKPGAEKSINVTFKSEGKRGFQQKTVTVMANTIPNTRVLTIKAQVVAPDNTQ